MAAVLACRDVHRSYRNKSGVTDVLKGVNLEVAGGEVCAILGPSGSGKSTLLRLLAGLDRPDKGAIKWDSFPVHEHRPSDLAAVRSRNVGLVFQQHYLLDDLNVTENVSLPGRIRNEPDDGRAAELLELVGLSERAGFMPEQLSGGEKQRVAVARALFDRPPIILADEPTGSLDRQNAFAVYRLLVELARERGSAVLLVTHDEGLVKDVDTRYLLAAGRLEPVGEPTI